MTEVLARPALPGATLSATRARSASRRAWGIELRSMLVLAGPMAATQLGQILIHGTEVVLLGRLGPRPLASVTLAWLLFYAAFVMAMGVAQATAPLIAAAKGAGRPRDVRRAVTQGLWISLLVSLPLMAFLWAGRPILRALGQEEGLLADTAAYLQIVGLALPFSTGFIVLRNFVAAYDRTRPVLVIVYAVFLVNIPLSAALVFGAFGLPGLGVTGAALGAALSWTIMFAALLFWCRRAQPFRRFPILAGLTRPDWPTFFQVWRLGLPIGFAMLLETGLFAAAAVMMGWLGAEALASHQVTLQIAATSFMVPLGISNAATIRVGLAFGAGDAAGVRRAAWTATVLGVGFMAGTALLFVTIGQRLVAAVFDPAGEGAAQTIQLAATLIQVAGLFQLVDGLQVIVIGNLRGLQDTTVPMWLAGAGYWGLGIPICALLGLATPLGPVGIWLGLAAGLAIVAAAMLGRFLQLSAPGRLEARLAGVS